MIEEIRENSNHIELLNKASRRSLGNGRAMSHQAMKALYDLRENNQLCDAVVILDDGTTFDVHRAVLSACSLYFR